jgi:hypothetical protein
LPSFSHIVNFLHGCGWGCSVTQASRCAASGFPLWRSRPTHHRVGAKVRKERRGKEKVLKKNEVAQARSYCRRSRVVFQARVSPKLTCRGFGPTSGPSTITCARIPPSLRLGMRAAVPFVRLLSLLSLPAVITCHPSHILPRTLQQRNEEGISCSEAGGCEDEWNG